LDVLDEEEGPSSLYLKRFFLLQDFEFEVHAKGGTHSSQG